MVDLGGQGTVGVGASSSSEKRPNEEAVRWSRWSAMWSRCAPLVEQQSWFHPLDGHEKAYAKEAVTSAALKLSIQSVDPTAREASARRRCERFARGYMPRPQWDTWTERLLALAKAAVDRG